MLTILPSLGVPASGFQASGALVGPSEQRRAPPPWAREAAFPRPGGRPPPLTPCVSGDSRSTPRHLNTTDGSLSRRIRSKIARNSPRGMATSAIWKTTYRECATTFAPILMSFSRSVSSATSASRRGAAPVGAGSCPGCTPGRTVADAPGCPQTVVSTGEIRDKIASE